MGLATFDGRGPPGAVRVRKGSTRRPETSPELWRLSTAKQKREAIQSYQDQLAEIRLAKSVPAAVARSGVPRLTRNESGTSSQNDPQTHRDKNSDEPTKVYPCCIARKLSRKEMESCPKAKRALDAEWEN